MTASLINLASPVEGEVGVAGARRGGRADCCFDHRSPTLPFKGGGSALALADRVVTSIDLAKTPSFRLDGKRALVTGGGRGIGLAAASALAAAGAQVTLAARIKSEIEQAAAAFRGRGETADALVLDVTDVEAVRKAVAQG